uniref:Uncharacterized protein n=1 Tax=Sphaerodactylus townsendi TaxID=933632 RepID=A0ACB8FMS3_9SAUR
MRYNCVKNYKRKAGTSSLVVCHENKTTKTFQWVRNLICIRDPAKPESEHVTEEAKKETERPTPASQPASPKPSAHPAAVSGDPYGSETTPSTATTQLRTTKPFREEPTTMPTPQETGGGFLGTHAETVTACKATKRKDSQPKSTKLPFGAFSTEIGNVTAVPSRNTPGRTTRGSQADIRQGQTGRHAKRAVFPPH